MNNWVTAAAPTIAVFVAYWLQSRKIHAVHVLVNSQLHAVIERLNVSQAKLSESQAKVQILSNQITNGGDTPHATID